MILGNTFVAGGIGAIYGFVEEYSSENIVIKFIFHDLLFGANVM